MHPPDSDIAYGAMQEQLMATGRIVFHDTTFEEFEALFRFLAEPLGHRDSGDDAVTRISPRHRLAGLPGYDGFTHRRLPPHIDGSGLVEPPEVLGTICTVASSVGGEALLVDGRTLVAALLEHPDVFAELIDPHLCIFGNEPSVAAAIVEAIDDGYLLRYRDDRLIHPAFEASTFDLLRSMIERFTETLPLQPGDGYIVLNRWWLHGRNEFVGDREIRRILGRSRMPIRSFAPSVATPV